jgi:hypothetical protein
MFQATTDDLLGSQLLRIARDPDLRRMVYERLGEYCHQCRNRLNSLKLSLYLAMKNTPPASPDLWVDIEHQYRELERRVDRVQTLCRPIILSRVTLGLELLIDDRREAWREVMSSNGRELEFVAPAERAVANFDVERLGQVFDSLVAWRASDHSSGSSARLRWWFEAGHAHIAWEEPLESGPTPRSSPSAFGATWTIPLLARVVLAHDGDLFVSEERGWRLEVSWPSLPTSL